MPELDEQMYCSQQIVIPPKFPYILKSYAKAAIKTQPYDLLRWSYEYFKALGEHRVPPVKMRLEYPIFNTEGGLTRGYLKVLACQLEGLEDVPLVQIRSLWEGACLDVQELERMFCLCEVFMRSETVPKDRFLAVAGGFLTKGLTQTMILLCETLTKEPDGGSAAIPLDVFKKMYQFLAKCDASKKVTYCNGYREGETPPIQSVTEEEEPEVEEEQTESEFSDEFWEDARNLKKLNVIDDAIAVSNKLCQKYLLPLVGQIERKPSVERAWQIEKETIIRERKGRHSSDAFIEAMLLKMNASTVGDATENVQDDVIQEENMIDIKVYDENDEEIPFEFYGEPKYDEEYGGEEMEGEIEPVPEEIGEFAEEEEDIAAFVAGCYNVRNQRREDLEQTFIDLAEIVERFKYAYYDLGMVAGRQMSATSGEFIAQQVEKEIMAFIDEQIAVLPDPDMKKKKAKPWEVAFIHEMVMQFIDDNMHIFVPDVEDVEEEEQAVPVIIKVYAVPGIGPVVDQETIDKFLQYADEVAVAQKDVFMPRNIRHFMCPPLEHLPDQDYSKPAKEELPLAGILTD